jgi:dUTP pyrophosphatase
VLFKLGISIEVPKGYEATIRSRSGLGAKHGFCVRQGIGTIDCGYSGELAVYMVNNSNEILEIKNGDRIAQLVVSPISLPDWEEATLTAGSSRGTGGFGSTDKT